MNKIEVFHKAFENEISHVATMKMPMNKNTEPIDCLLILIFL